MTEELDDIELMDAEPDGQLYEHLRMEVDRGQEPVRIDKYMSEHVQHSSRNRIQKAADAGFIQVNLCCLQQSLQFRLDQQFGDVLV